MIGRYLVLCFATHFVLGSLFVSNYDDRNPHRLIVVSAFGGRLWNKIRRRGARQISPGTTVVDAQDALLGRRTINNFEPTLPDEWEEMLRQAVNAATYAPNHKRTEPWRFRLLGPESIRTVCEINCDLVAAKKGTEAGKKKLDRWLAMPGWLVVTCQKSRDGDGDGDDAMLQPMSLAREDYAACCCAVQNLCLSLHANGMGTKWTTGPVNFDSRFADAVGFLPEEEYVVGTIWFGTPTGAEPSPPIKKLALDDVLIRQA
mmetsp:Transcript_48554/g.117457  ORF Transcript_48554/g.117457 Transcript_48554/m.117457 type:complete len:259 (-) Transcript_48554:115-891(-)|eukprot:CAMPEP_0113448326 /NCGR_PEP_ID=MMETSP0014_2-20120614/4709_1 /TAXON_ID=2857 /ORGANISM="Nitzschia sp." /LENGTH=258 /DNA_ID=CAMNT_0000339535 /DNA_START=2031 /DNA_END=2807 /DNA_ORIENTATION=- /assembly_acc=CAM_ASM_000159